MNEERRPNRLADETSPYLLQHAYNPVDWYPWGEEAFERARREDKPIFLSIGYSTCHWCHVMAHESFEDEEVARLLNENFVCIKVDREERPDVDRTYINIAQAMIGHAGWPLTIFMTPDKVPFFAATYIPKYPSRGRHGMLSLLPLISEMWRTRRDEIERVGEQLKRALATAPSLAGRLPSVEVFDEAFQVYLDTFDSTWGGFGTAPKFPAPHNLMFLLRHWRITGDTRAVQMVEQTLTAMRRGGIFDQVGFGFHRYSTDSQWRLPHFEKMLYDQAMHIMAYTEAYQVTGKTEYAKTVAEVVEYLTRDLMSPDGAFYSAEDADSEGREGAFYLWSVEELSDVLSPEELKVVTTAFSLSEDGNFHDEATGRRTGLNLLYWSLPPDRVAWELDMDAGSVLDILESARRKMLERRATRERPLRDEKILTDWNGLVIAALAKAGAAISPEFLQIAERALRAVVESLMSDDGELYHSSARGSLGQVAFLDDYAFLVWGLLELYEATSDPGHLRLARDLHNKMLELFEDRENGGLFFSGDRAEQLLVRDKSAYDGAIPSGNSVAALNSVRLSRLTGDPALEDGCRRIVQAFSASIERSPTAHSMMLCALTYLRGPSHELVIVGDDSDIDEMLRSVRSWFLPHTALVVKTPRNVSAGLEELAPYTSEYPVPSDGHPVAYVCSGQTCSPPVTDVDELRSLLDVRSLV